MTQTSIRQEKPPRTVFSQPSNGRTRGWTRRGALRPRILFVSYTADWAGPTNSLLLLLKHLRQTYDVAVVLPDTGGFSVELANEDIPFFSLPSLGKEAIPRLVRLIRDEGFDLVYANNTSGSSRNAFLAAKLARVPFVCHVRGMGRTQSWRQLFYLRFADAVIAVSDACAQATAPYVAPGRLHVVHNGVAVSEFPEPDTAASSASMADVGIRSRETVVVSVAHLKPRKGQEFAIRAVHALVEDVPSLQLLLVGSLNRDPAYVEKLRTLVDDLNLGNNVSMAGFRRDIPRLLHAADVFVHTALSDPHPRAVIEAMAAGLPVVAFAVDGVAETVADGQTGYLVPERNVPELAGALRRVVTDRSLQERMGRTGRERVQRYFSAARTAEQVRDVIADVLEVRTVRE